MGKIYSYRASEEEETWIEAEAARNQTTPTDVIRRSLTTYIQQSGQRKNLDVLVYEIVKTRAVMVRGLDLSEEKEKLLLEEAGKDAEAYVEGRKT